MSRYIDAEKLERFFARDEWDTPDERWRPESEFGRFVDTLPTEDVSHVIHAHWEWHYDIDQDRDFKEPCSSEDKSGWICSHCKGRLADMVGGKWDEIEEPPELEYCPGCGATMDEDIPEDIPMEYFENGGI